VPSLENPKQKILAISLIVIGFVVVGLFGLRTFHALRGFRGHPPIPPPGKMETDVELIRDWMTIPFIAQSYHVPGVVLFDALQISPQDNYEKSLADLNRKYYPNERGFVLTKVKETVLANQPLLPPDAGAAPISPSPAQP
jgi:hypothetical protein